MPKKDRQGRYPTYGCRCHTEKIISGGGSCAHKNYIGMHRVQAA